MEELTKLNYKIEKYKSKHFDRCEEIYEDSFILDSIGIKNEGVFDLSDKRNKLFVFILNKETIGLGGYQTLNEKAYMIYGLFEKQYKFGKYNDILNNFILDEIKKNKSFKYITTYLTFQEEYDYFKKFGFTLYKDFATETPEIYKDNFGEQLSRFALDILL